MSTAKRQKIAADDKSDGNISYDSSSNYKGIETWREAAMSFRERNKYALKEGILSDVTFAVGPEKKIFNCHKTILSLASPVFEAMFFGSLKEANEVIQITDLMPTGFQLLLDYIYVDDMKLENATDAFAAWIAGDKYCLPYMKDICFRFLYDLTITDNNVWIILENSMFLNSEPLEDRCWNFLRKNASIAIETSSFLNVSEDVIKKLVLMESLCIKEVSLLFGVVKWFQEQKYSDSEGSRQKLLQPFLGHIRFGCMSQDEFVYFIDIHEGVISNSDALSILKYMTNDTLYPLPEWCSRNVNSRKIVPKRISTKSAIAAYALKPKRSHHSKRNCSPEANRSYHHPDDPIYHDYRTSFREESRLGYDDISDECSIVSDNNLASNSADTDSHSGLTDVSLSDSDTDETSDCD